MTTLHPIRPALLGLAALSLLALTPRPAAAAVYVVGNGFEFGTIDPTSGDFSMKGTLRVSGAILGAPLNAIGFVGNTLYGLSSGGYGYSGSGTDVYTIDLTTGEERIVGNVNDAAFTGAATGGTFYNLTFNQSGADTTLFTVDPTGPTEGSTTYNIPITVDGALGANGNTLYVADYGGSVNVTDQLFSVNATDGTDALIGDTGTANSFDFFAGVYTGGNLYGFGSADSNNNNATSIYTFDTTASDMTAGAATFVANYSLTKGTSDYITAAAVGPDFSAAPEPSQVAMLGMMGLGLGGLVLRARRRAAKP